MPEYPIVGFAPDMPQDTPGVIVGSSAILPTLRGVSCGVDVLSVSGTVPFQSCGGAMLDNIAASGVRKLIGTPSKLWELSGGAAIDVSGSAYSATQSDPWSFAQFGSVTLATNPFNTLQASSGFLSAFANVSGAPKGGIVAVVGKPNATFAMLFDYDDGTRTKDGIFWSGIGAYTAWTPSIATQCGKVRLLDINGPIVAAIPYRDGVICWKANAMYQGTYVGAPDLWAWRRISSDVGCVAKNACCEANDRIYFADANGVWMYDGSYPVQVPGALTQWWAANVGQGQNRVRLTWDKQHNQLWVGLGNFPIETYLVYNTQSQRWTYYGQAAANNFAVSELFNMEHASIAAQASPLTSTQFGKLSRGGQPAATIRLAASGKAFGMTTFRGIRPQFEAGAADRVTPWASGTLYHGPSLRNVTGQSDVMTFTPPGKFECVRQDRFVAPALSFAPGFAWEISNIAVDTSYNPSGE